MAKPKPRPPGELVAPFGKLGTKILRKPSVKPKGPRKDKP